MIGSGRVQGQSRGCADEMRRMLKTEPFIGGLVAAAVYVGVAYFVRPARMIELLNGAYFGVLATVFVVWWRTGWEAIRGIGRYGRVQRFALSIALQWIAFSMLRGLSAVVRSADDLNWVRDSHAAAIPLFIAVIAGIMQVTAPGMGPDPEEGKRTPSQLFVQGRDKPLLLLGLAVGLIVACVVIAFESLAAP